MNDPLAALRPLHAPPPIAWWPPAPGWWVLMLALLLLLAGGWLWWRKRVLRRAALAELKSLSAAGLPPVDLAAAINQLLKRYALACYPWVDVAGLQGASWLAFLDAHGGGEHFTRGEARVLRNLPYQAASETLDGSALIQVARRWIQQNLPGSH